MSRIDCGSGDVPCLCDPVSGCGHASSWHRVFTRWVARCLVPDCHCRTMDACNCVEGLDGVSDTDQQDAKILAQMGISAS